jgi:aspartate racemase
MAKHIGIVACSAEGAALCYRTICAEAPKMMGEFYHPEISMHTFPLGEYMIPIRAGDWKKVSELMLTSARKLAEIGADFVICPDNTIHEAFDLVINSSPLPWIHIAEAVSQEAQNCGYKKLGITGTKYLMDGPVYPQKLAQNKIEYTFPDKKVRGKIDTLIFKELVNGIFTERTRLYFNNVFEKLKEKGCDAVVLGCTEIPLIVDPQNSPLPTLDSTRILARAAIREALR